MFFDLNYQSGSLLFFFLQGLVFAALLWRKGKEQEVAASKWLSIFILLCCFYITPWMCGHSNWYARDGYREFLFFVPFQQLFLIGPVIYFYTLNLLSSSFEFQRKHYWHFVPGVLYLGYSLVVFVTDQLILEEYYFYADGRDKDLAPWYQITGLISIMTYVVGSIRCYNEYRLRIFAELSFADTVVFQWVKQYLFALLIILTLRVFFLILYPDWGSFGEKFYYYLSFSILYYYIALMGYTATLVSLPVRWVGILGKETIKDNHQHEQSDQTVLDQLTSQEEDLIESIRKLMEEEKIFQQPMLTLNDIAGLLNVTSKQISRLINQAFQQNFNDFVNGYRVVEVQAQFIEGKHHEFTLLSIALASGFNSKTTFNRVFKRFTGQTPRVFLEELERKKRR